MKKQRFFFIETLLQTQGCPDPVYWQDKAQGPPNKVGGLLIGNMMIY